MGLERERKRESLALAICEIKREKGTVEMSGKWIEIENQKRRKKICRAYVAAFNPNHVT